MEKKSLVKKLTGSREALLAVVLIVLFIVITAINPSFLTPKSLMDMLKNNAVTMVMALGRVHTSLVAARLCKVWLATCPILSPVIRPRQPHFFAKCSAIRIIYRRMIIVSSS